MELEHVNITVSDPDATAAVLCNLFDWNVRWSGEAMDNGYTVHVGSKSSYLALYRPGKSLVAIGDTYATIAGLNHIGVVVEDIAAVDDRVKSAGFAPHSHSDYEPGQRFYFDGPDGIEFEVVQYS